MVLMPREHGPYVPQHVFCQDLVLMPRWHAVLLSHVLYRINPVTQIMHHDVRYWCIYGLILLQT